ncbi:TadE family protein [Vibrio owensii]|uniref:TadE family protein n=1 Tax=Vibrio owensii TaxID=696485 RepID=UPI00289628CC|nr:Pilus assembly protein TadE [Vibrio owensii]
MEYSRRKVKGVTVVEFALGAGVLALALVMLFEMGFRIYVTNLVEYALRESVRNTKVFEGGSSYDNYNLTLDSAMKDGGALWTSLVPAENFEVSGRYYLTYADLISGTSYSDAEMGEDDQGYAIAEITLTYNYTPILNVFSSDVIPITKSTLINLEHEGWEE